MANNYKMKTRMNKRNFAPLRSFVDAMKQHNGNTTITISTADANVGELGLHKDTTDKSKGSSKCRPRCAEWLYTFSSRYTKNPSKSRRRKRHRASKIFRSNSKSNAHHTFSRIEGQCKCGAAVEILYFDKCENCFAEDAHRWSGKDKSAKIRF